MYAFLVLAISVSAVALAELMSYMFIYRTPRYQALKLAIENLASQQSKQKDKGKSNKVRNLSNQLKEKNRDISMLKLKSTVFNMIVLAGVFQLLGSLFDGVVVAKLPFTPFPLIRGLSHRGLSGTDFTDCGLHFIYILGSLSFRSNIQRFFGFAPSKGLQPNPFADVAAQ
jgi:hypothetical protein